MIGETSDNHEATTSGGTSRWAHGAVLGAVCVLIIGFFAWSAKSGFKELLNSKPADSYYNLLVQGFRAGQLNVKREAPPELMQQPDPYKSPADFYRSVGEIGDMSYYKGKLYLYFGITPALVLFWPYVALTGHYLLHKEAVVIFCSLGFLAGVWLLCALWRRYFAEVSFGVVVAGALALGLGMGTPLLLKECDFYEAAISCGYALTMVALVGIWKAMHEPERGCWWLAGASMAYGLAVGARPNLLFGGVILLVPVLGAWRERRRVRPVLMAAVVPMAVIGLGLMLYNYLRFNNPLEFGERYQLPTENLHAQLFSLRYLWFDFRLYFLEAARWSGRFPFIREIAVPPLPAGYYVVAPHFGVLSNIPVIWLALAAPLVWRGRTAGIGSVLRRFVTAVVLLFGICVLTLCLYSTVTFRYEMDFLPALGLLAVIGIFGLERVLTGRLAWRNAVRWGWGVLLVISVAFNLFVSYERSADFHHNLGSILYDKGHVDEAITQFQKALEIRPNDVEAHNGLGSALLQKGQKDEAIAQFQKALELQPNNAMPHYNLGLALRRKGQVDEAIIQFKRAVELQTKYPDAHNNLGVVLLQKGQVDEAITQFQKALELKPDSTMAYDNLGIAFLERGEVDEAIAHLQKALELQPANAGAHNNLGLALLQKGRVGEAITHCQKALELRPNYPEACYNLGNALVQKSQMREAITCFQKALALQPNDSEIQNQLAWLLATCPDASIRNGSKAIQLAQQADQLVGGRNPVILRTLAAAYAENGQFPEAVTTAQRALQLATAQNDAALVNDLKTQLGYYQAGSPFRDTRLTNAPASDTPNTFREVGK